MRKWRAFEQCDKLYDRMAVEAVDGLWSGVWSQLIVDVLQYRNAKRHETVERRKDLLAMECIRLVKKDGWWSTYELLQRPSVELWPKTGHRGWNGRPPGTGPHQPGNPEWIQTTRANHARITDLWLANLQARFPDESLADMIGKIAAAPLAELRKLSVAANVPCLGFVIEDHTGVVGKHTCGVVGLDSEPIGFEVKRRVGRPSKDPAKDYVIVKTGDKT